ncbi:MAG: glycosyltransferase family 2 protein [Lachnospiraceae bacterium]|nr:glycosyltransferase family 2 protein [Lachnospiraceae bacterium]
MTLSVITPCFNSEKTIERTLQSLIDQIEYIDEYIVIDGLSTDNTLGIIKKYESAFNGKLRIVSEKDNGIYDAMNKGIRLATGDLIGIINSDDWYERNALKTVLNKYDGSKYCIIYGMLKVWQNGKLKSAYFKSHEFIEEAMIAHPTCFVTKTVYEDYGLYNTAYKSSSDYEFILNASKRKDVKFIPVLEFISNFTADGMSSGQKGVRETLHIQYKNGLISYKNYIFHTTKSKIYELLHR